MRDTYVVRAVEVKIRIVTIEMFAVCFVVDVLLDRSLEVYG